MANIVFIVGRLTGDPVTKAVGSTTKTSGTVAAERSFKQDGQPTADFINFTIWGKRGEAFAKYHHKGSPAILTGEWRTGSYTNQNGQKVYTNDMFVSEWEFAPKDKSQGQANNGGVNGYVNNVGGDEELPFT